MLTLEVADGLFEFARDVEGGEAIGCHGVGSFVGAGAAGVVAQQRVERAEAVVLNVSVATQVFQ